MNWDISVLLWWLFLSGIGLFNIFLWFRLRRILGAPAPVYLWLCGLYVFGCAFRSFLPRADVQRFVIFDGFLSSIFVGRSVATVAELAFVAQWAAVLFLVSKITDQRSVRILSLVIFPLIFIAEIFSWYAVLSTNYIGSVCEESLWGISFSLTAIAVFLLKKELNEKGRMIAWASLVGLVIYVSYMFLVDVPMYYSRWISDRARGVPVVGLSEGLYGSLTRWRVSRSIDDWKYEMLWMSLYFSFAVWSSLLLNRVPSRIKGYLRPHP